MVTVSVEEKVEIPPGIENLEAFRAWTHSDAFPERGRIDFIGGRIEVDMQAEAMYSHGGVKAAILRLLLNLVWDEDLGEIYTDRMRIASIPADLSTEPDVVYLSHRTLESDKVHLVPKANRDDEFVEIQGAVDMVAEIVSDSSVVKDNRRLPVAYFDAGVLEYWLIDARGDELLFQIHTRGQDAFQAVHVDSDGFQPSAVFSRNFQLLRSRNRRGHWQYELTTNA